MARRKLDPPIIGIDQLSDETKLLASEGVKAIREGVNIDIDRSGNISRRLGASIQKAGSGYHSLYSSKRGWLFCCHKKELGFYTPSTTTFTSLVDMNDYFQVSYDELNGNVYAFNPTFSCYFPPADTTAYTVGVPLPATTPSFADASGGNLTSGKYGITYTVIGENGEESGTGPVVTVEVTNGAIQGTLFEILTDVYYRIYMTTADGEEFYQAAEFEANTVSFKITHHEEGRQPRTLYLEPLPYGYFVRAYNSRLFVATNDFVFFSDVFRPHLYNPAHHFLPTTGITSLLQPVDKGIYIGDRRGVRFYAGEDPTSFEVMEVSHEVPVYGTGISIPGDFLDPELGVGKDIVAVWLTTSGFNIGLPNGELLRAHAQQVRLPAYIQGCSTTMLRDGRKQLITPVKSNVTGAASIAVDSDVDV